MSAYTYVVVSDSGRTGVAVTTGCSGVGPVPGCGEEGQSFFCVCVCVCRYGLDGKGIGLERLGEKQQSDLLLGFG